jgi:hypothetical protein
MDFPSLRPFAGRVCVICYSSEKHCNLHSHSSSMLHVKRGQEGLVLQSLKFSVTEKSRNPNIQRFN